MSVIRAFTAYNNSIDWSFTGAGGGGGRVLAHAAQAAEGSSGSNTLYENKTGKTFNASQLPETPP